MSWTAQQAEAWAKVWSEPVMQQGLAHLKEITRLSGTTTDFATVPNIMERYALMAAHSQGGSDVFEKIDAMKARATQKPLPPPFETTPRPTERT